MSASQRLSFDLPIINYRLPLPVSQQEVEQMTVFTQSIQARNSQSFEKMLETINKVAPIALALIAGIALSPVWLPIASITSFLLGPIAWLGVGVGGAVIWDVAQTVFTCFTRQHQRIIDFVAAKIISCQNAEEHAGLRDLEGRGSTANSEWAGFTTLRVSR